MNIQQIEEWHVAGIHLHCKPGKRRQPAAGKVERFHHHDFDGPLPCDCDTQ